MTTKQLYTYARFFVIAVLAICFSLIVLKVLSNLLLILVGMMLTIAVWFFAGGQEKYPIKLFKQD